SDVADRLERPSPTLEPVIYRIGATMYRDPALNSARTIQHFGANATTGGIAHRVRWRLFIQGGQAAGWPARHGCQAPGARSSDRRPRCARGLPADAAQPRSTLATLSW